MHVVHFFKKQKKVHNVHTLCRKFTKKTKKQKKNKTFFLDTSRSIQGPNFEYDIDLKVLT